MDKITELPVKVDVSAKASLELKAEIPTAATGRFVDAITDLIRPWSENRGLKADLIRLQREDVAFEIVRRAAERARLQDAKPEPIPLKILVPLLERGSQEAPGDDFMIDMWANLLAAAKFGKGVQPRFVGIIGELNGSQARLLQHISSAKFVNGHFTIHQHDFLNILDEMLRRKPALSAEQVGNEIYQMFDRNGHFLVSCHVSTPGEKGDLLEWEGPPLENVGPLLETDLEILASLGLLARVNIASHIGRPHLDHVTLTYYYTTFLADDFLEAVTLGPKSERLQAGADIASK